MPDDISPELLEVYAIESEDHLRNISTQLEILKNEPANKEVLQEIRRTVHTLKGAAGAVGLHPVSELAHRMEDLLDQVYDGLLSIDSAGLELLFGSTDALEDLSTANRWDDELKYRLADLYHEYASLVPLKTESSEVMLPPELAGETYAFEPMAGEDTTAGNGKGGEIDEQELTEIISAREVYQTQNIADVIDSYWELGDFSRLLGISGLNEWLSEQKEVTVFAYGNNLVRNIPTNTLFGWQKGQDTHGLSEFLKSLIIPGSYTIKEILSPLIN